MKTMVEKLICEKEALQKETEKLSSITVEQRNGLAQKMQELQEMEKAMAEHDANLKAQQAAKQKQVEDAIRRNEELEATIKEQREREL